MKVITRFAPSPTGYLHIGGARTALFNYLFAKHYNGQFLLRIEDTDLQRSTKEAVDAIFNGLNWLGITSDEEPVFQMQRQARHIEVAKELLLSGNAYKCYCTKAELEQRREQAEKQGGVYVYDGRCRNITEDKNSPYAIRIKIDKSQSTIIEDLVMGKIEVQNSQIDDFIILRSDEVPTYMFAVVVDDHDMDITHIIRGDDHLTNAFRQYHIYKALNWFVPAFAHLPLIHSSDGTKMSKRYGAVAVEDYQAMGFLPSGIKNYLLKLGWSHNDDEIISQSDAIAWFDIKDVNKSPARFDMVKLNSINGYYINSMDNDTLIEYLQPFIDKNIANFSSEYINNNYHQYLSLGINSIKARSKNLVELAENSMFYVLKPTAFALDVECKNLISTNQDLLKKYIEYIAKFDWTKNALHDATKMFAETEGLKLGKVAELIRIGLCGSKVCPASNFEIMEILGKQESLYRLNLVV